MDTVTPVGTAWHVDLQEWLEPFLAVFKRSEQRYGHHFSCKDFPFRQRARALSQWPSACAPGQTQQLHHFVSTSTWSTAPLEQVMRKTADVRRAILAALRPVIYIQCPHCGATKNLRQHD